MDTRWLQDFITLSELRNFTRAAETRNLSQAAFSRRIQSLENWAGARLIDRSAFPTQLTEAGERFLVSAIELVNQLAEARAGIAAVPARNQLRLATSYALATTHLPGWWRKWSAGQQLSCSLQTGNVHDTVSAFTSGTADLLICFHQVAQPLPLDLARYESLTLGTELIRPYASRALLARDGLDFPGTLARPAPLLMYSPNVYFARLIDAAIENGPEPLHGVKLFEAEMSDVLGDMAAQGLGVAWLADSALQRRGVADLQPLANRAWDIEVAILAFKDRRDARPAVDALWQRMRAMAQPA
ncbi:LysR family transcriptional regulator [Streptomyces cavourensis]|jgi:DNA-binding transcriptional LysR family regulator|uniref:LysR family transcriptional regulator n=1 Tax=unclassified Achromobacter TaxID=2626865 RepID=UPI000E028BC4|nr:LysR family transcriptional regulator [Streptomyces cavourensis]